MLTRTDLLTLARLYDDGACWSSDEPDDNCLLLKNDSAVPSLVASDPWGGAYEDPNEGVLQTRVVFPMMPMVEDN
jgi:hypothetical protein